MSYSSKSMWVHRRSRLSETDLVRKGGKLAPTTFCEVGECLVILYPPTRGSRQRPQRQDVSDAAQLLVVAEEVNASTCSKGRSSYFSRTGCLHHVVDCMRRRFTGMRGGLRVAEVGHSYPFQQVDRDPWAMPKLFEAPGYDSEWTYTDEEDNEEVAQSGALEEIVEEPPASLCGNAVLEVGEDCDLGDENGHWDEGRSLDALCTIDLPRSRSGGETLSRRGLTSTT